MVADTKGGHTPSRETTEKQPPQVLYRKQHAAVVVAAQVGLLTNSTHDNHTAHTQFHTQ